jgi:methylated-DNA-[protein]-cysteine S-methyltransferase
LPDVDPAQTEIRTINMPDTDLRFTWIESPVGALLIAGDGEKVHHIRFPHGHDAAPPSVGWVRDDSCLPEARRQLTAYFAGTLRTFDLPLALFGTRFQERVWRALAEIPYGETRSYRWLAGQLGAPDASRAVGAANGANPLPIVLPCHRVIGSDGSLTGFGGGIETKRFLLAHEGAAAGAAGEQLSLL